jgi:hypothetical protein
MASDEHVALLKQGVTAWNAWRQSQRECTGAHFSVCGPARKRQCSALIARYSPLIGDTVSVQVRVALLALIGTDYSATERGTVLTVAPIDPNGQLSRFGTSWTLSPDRTMM